MASNDINIGNIGGRFKLIDPNKFENQSAGNNFGDPNYNMSVPLEDLSIAVELKTSTKDRTILISSNNDNSIVAKNQKGFVVNFINGVTDNTTNNENFLTTNYTNVSTELKSNEESFGITKIDISFNSSYAPMVTINFIDVRGGAIFNPQGDSPYSVFFRLPYPLFELKVKGFYGKPVTYCLHMLKFNSKFNSQTGNFEITANFVGYTYAMLSDMIIGYLKAAGSTKEGKEYLDSNHVPRINDFLSKAASIDQKVQEQVLNNDTDTKNLYIIRELKTDLENLRTKTFAAIQSFKEINTSTEATIVSNLGSYSIIGLLTNNKSKVSYPKTNEILINYQNQFDIIVKKYNEKVSSYEQANNISLSVNTNKKPYGVFITPLQLFDPNSDEYVKSIATASPYNINAIDISQINSLKERLTNAYGEVKNLNELTLGVDFTDVLDEIAKRIQNLNTEEEDTSKLIAQKIKNTIKTELGFDSTLRSIFNIFTTHVEAFLKQIFTVSSKYESSVRLNELYKVVNNLDVKNTTNGSNGQKPIIYPWPEYQENNEEKYLGSSKGPLSNPLNVPEIEFVEKLYEIMISDAEALQNFNNLVEKNKLSWYSTNPLDSNLYLSTSPYDRLDASANPDDFARLIAIRASGFLLFSNRNLSEDEINIFAENEANLIIEKLKDSKQILQGIVTNYSDDTKYLKTYATINNKKTLLLYNKKSKLSYSFFDSGIEVLPIEKSFNNTTFSYKNGTTDTLGVFLSGRFSDSVVKDKILYDYTKFEDNANYITFVSSSDYENQTSLTNPTGSESVFNFSNLKADLKTPDDMKSAGFIANSGKYGVQEFKKIKYDTNEYPNTELDFYTLFYDNVSGYFPSTISQPRKKESTFLPDYDFQTDKNVDNTFKVYSYSEYDDFYKMLDKIYKNHDGLGETINNISLGTNNTTYPFFDFAFISKESDLTTIPINLFGSRFYFNQTNRGKAFLFLHCFPWRGLANTYIPERSLFTLQSFRNLEGIVGPFNKKEILNAFQYRTGFIQTPRMFILFLGAIIWRYESGGVAGTVNFQSKLKNITDGGTDPIYFGEEGDYYLPTNLYPKTHQYLKADNSDILTSDSTFFQKAAVYPMSFSNYGDAVYTEIDSILKNLMTPIKEALVDYFLYFADNEYKDEIAPIFDIFPKNEKNTLLINDSDWKKSWENIVNSKTTFTDSNGITYNVNKPENIRKNLGLLNKKTFEERYKIFSYYNDVVDSVLYNGQTQQNLKYNYLVEYKAGSDADTKLKELFFDIFYISNNTYAPWNIEYQKSQDAFWGATNYNGLTTDYVKFVNYIKKLNEKLSAKVNEYQTTKFNLKESEQIKLEIYRTCKKIYDKWVASNDSWDKAIFQCCTKNKTTNKADRLSGDTQQMLHRLNKPKKPEAVELDSENEIAIILTDTEKLIDSFRFVNRAFKDIGDDVPINPMMVSKLLLQSTNMSFYDLISRILTENNFDFIALPNFIDYNNPKELQSVFKPYPYYELDEISETGPSFICMYVGQTSTKLDFSNTGNDQYPNDGFDLADPCVNCPDDIANGVKKDHEDVAASFIVRYGQQNQNFFKDIILDQAEFSETAESLQITDAIANKFSQTNQTYVSQNLFNVYSSRSYKVEVEMMGDAMIQPMMYFQLDNIPMFHGAYLITKVNHSIQSNSMSTTFTGTRIKKTLTPLIDDLTLYSTLINGYEFKRDLNPTLTPTKSGSYAPIVITILENGGSNANIENGSGNITLKQIPKIAGVNNTKIGASNKADSLLTEAADSLVLMLKDFVSFAKQNSFPTNNNNYIGITSLYRNYEKQKSLYDDDVAKNGGKPSGFVAAPGTSNHGWGIAVDFVFIDINGNQIGITKNNLSSGFDFNFNKSLKWFADNSYKYGFIIPKNLRDGNAVNEFWHFEYHGTAAICILNQFPYYRNYKVNVTGSYVQGAVLNPLKPDKTRAVYDNCNYKSFGPADGNESATTKLSNAQLTKNQVTVKNYLKNYLKGNPKAKEIAAGIMGNIQKESSFNPTAGGSDIHDYSYGLIQWNTGTYKNAKSDVGNSVDTQIKKVVDGYTNGFDTFLKEANNTVNLTPYNSAFLFAKYVEICFACTNETDYKNGKSTMYRNKWVFIKPSERSEYANDFFARFNTKGDSLEW